MCSVHHIIGMVAMVTAMLSSLWLRALPAWHSIARITMNAFRVWWIALVCVWGVDYCLMWRIKHYT